MKNNSKMATIKGACGLRRANGDLPVCSVRNRVIETKKFKKKHTDAWKKEARCYALKKGE